MSLLNLTDTQRARISDAHTAARKFLANHPDVSSRLIDSHLQGSYILRTVVNPDAGDSYDADVMLELDTEGLDSQGVLQMLMDAFKSSDKYRDRVSDDCPSIRIDFAADEQDREFYLDITPGRFADDDNYPDTTIEILPNWTKSNPRGFIDWHEGVNKLNKDFRKIVILMKYWRDLHYGQKHSPSSMLLSVVLASALPKKSQIHIEDTLVKTLSTLTDRWKDLMEVPIFWNPSFDDGVENLSEDWSFEEFAQFRDDISKMVEMIHHAVDSDIEEDSINIWNAPNMFDGQFPTKTYGLTEKYSIAKALSLADKKGQAFIEQSGKVFAAVGAVASTSKASPYNLHFGTEVEENGD